MADHGRSDGSLHTLAEGAEEPQPGPQPAGDARESTELARLRRNYSRASSSRPRTSSPASRPPTGLLERFTYSISKFWRHQISVTVTHASSRDHLGMKIKPSIFLSCFTFHSSDSDKVSNMRFPPFRFRKLPSEVFSLQRVIRTSYT